MSRQRRKMDILANYNPLFDGVSEAKEAEERHALAQRIKDKTLLRKSVTSQGPQGENQPSTHQAAKCGEGPVDPVAQPSGANLPQQFLDSIAVFDSFICDEKDCPPMLYVSEQFDVIGWDGPPEAAKLVINRVHDGFRRNFYQLTKELWKRMCSEVERVFADPETTDSKREEIFEKLDPVIERARINGWPSA